jgi:hypothetical protein
MAVALKVIGGIRPSRPENIPNNLWKLLQDCWAQNPEKRLQAADITLRLVGPAIGAAKAMESATDWDKTFSSKCRRSLQEWPLLPSVTAIERRIFGDGTRSGIALVTQL